jgi:hypothetical protein
VNTRFSIAVIGLSLLLLLSGCGSQVLTLETQEAPVGKADPNMKVESLIISPDGTHVAYVATRSGQEVVIFDAKEGSPYDKIVNLSLSPDGTRVGYGAARGQQVVVVVDQAEASLCFDIGEGTPRFSADGKRVASIIYEGKNSWLLLADGRKSKPFDAFAANSLVFSPDGARLACGIRRQGKWVVSVDGAEGVELDGVAGVTFSPDSKHIAYRGVRAEGVTGKIMKHTAVLDGTESKAFEKILGTLCFSPDGGKLAYIAQLDGKQMLMVNYTPTKAYKAIAVDSQKFSPDGSRVAFIADNGEGALIVVDGKESMPYASVGRPEFSGDGQHLAFVAKRDNKWLVVSDGNEGPPSEDEILPGSLALSNDGKRMAYMRARQGDWIVVSGKTESKIYDEVLAGPVFSPDGKLVFCAKRKAQYFMVVEGAESQPYDGMPRGAKVTFDSAGAPRALFYKAGQILRVTAGK